MQHFAASTNISTLEHLHTYTMKKIFTILLLCAVFRQVQAQVHVSGKIDTTSQKAKDLCHFINAYMSQDTLTNRLWHPKYKNRTFYDYNMDWLWNRYSPKKYAAKFNLQLVELQSINDTLSYFKLLALSKPDKQGNTYTNVYKYYIVAKGGQYYLDNCKAYDSKLFVRYQTKYIHFYISPFYSISKKAMYRAGESLDSIRRVLKRPPLKAPIEYYMCSNEGELNNLANMMIWGNGGLTGFTNNVDGYVVGINDQPAYQHEFIHAVLGPGANCFFLQEGIATLYGGTDKGRTSYLKGIRELKSCYSTGDCNFDNLYAREVNGKYNSSLTYTFAAACCKYLIDHYGTDFFYQLYYDKSITSDNFLEKVRQKTGKSREALKTEIEKEIL